MCLLTSICAYLQAEKNETYIENFKKIEKLVLVLFERDSMVNPRESSWFGFYAPGQSTIVLPYNETDLYKNVSFLRFFSFLKFKYIVNRPECYDGKYLSFIRQKIMLVTAQILKYWEY